MTDAYELATARTFQEFATPFQALKVARQNTQWAIDPSYGLTRQRMAWFSDGTRFDSTRFTESGGEIQVSTGTGASNKGRWHSAYPGQYIAHALSEPGLGLRIPSTHLSYSNGRVSLSHGTIQWGPFWHDGTSITDGFFFELDSSGLRFRLIKGGSEVNKVAQEDWNVDPMDGSGPSGDTLKLEDGFIYNYPYTYYNQGRLGIGRMNPENTDKPSEFQPFHREVVTEEPNLETPQLPVQVLVDNDGTGQDLTVGIGGAQYTTYGADSEAEQRVTRIPSNDTSISTQVNSPIDPTSTPGDPVIAIQRESGNQELNAELANIEVVTDNDVFVYIWDTWDPSTDLTDQSFEDPPGINKDAESRLVMDRSATAFSVNDSIFRGVFRFEGGGGPQRENLLAADPDERLPIDATRVLTAVHDGSSATVDIIARTIERY